MCVCMYAWVLIGYVSSLHTHTVVYVCVYACTNMRVRVRLDLTYSWTCMWISSTIVYIQLRSAQQVNNTFRVYIQIYIYKHIYVYI